MPEAPRTNDLTAHEHEVWLAVYLETLKHERAKSAYLPGYEAERAAREAVLHLRKMTLAETEAAPQEAANG